MRLALAGVGNNASALVQGLAFYRRDPEMVRTLTHPEIEGVTLEDIDIVAAFDTSPSKLGIPLGEAVLVGNVFPDLGIPAMPGSQIVVEPGIASTHIPHDVRRVAGLLEASRAEVLLLGLPAEREDVAKGYAAAALTARVGVVNCSPDRIARDERLLRAFTEAKVPLLGDDLASQFGSSLVHRTLLKLARNRGLHVTSTYQVNIGGNADFENLRTHSEAKRRSKLNVLRDAFDDDESLTVIPSGGYIPTLRDSKVAFVSIEGTGWAGQTFNLELRLSVQDSANAAGVIIDLIRYAYVSRRAGIGGFVDEARVLLKSPPGSQY